MRRIGVMLAAVVLATGSLLGAKVPADRYTAFAVALGTPGRTGAGQVEFVVERWSTDAERDRLLNTLFDKGPEKLLDALQDLPRVGYLRTPNSIGYDIHFARKRPGEDGGEIITLATDRYIGFWEAANRPRTVDYPFTVVEIRMNKNGEGEGKMSLATKITGNKESKMITLENYQSQPVLLNKVKRES
jgi:hypothetical protein